MSSRPTTNAERIEEIQRLLPPKKGVKSRLGYASLDHLAELLGTNRGRVISWKNGEEPSPAHRQRLAELSGGRYTPDDFRVRIRRGRAEDAAAGGAQLEALQDVLTELRDGLRSLRERVDRLEAAGRGRARRPARGQK